MKMCLMTRFALSRVRGWRGVDNAEALMSEPPTGVTARNGVGVRNLCKAALLPRLDGRTSNPLVVGCDVATRAGETAGIGRLMPAALVGRPPGPGEGEPRPNTPSDSRLELGGRELDDSAGGDRTVILTDQHEARMKPS